NRGTMRFEELDEFKKDLKQLVKKYRSLKDDLAVVKRVLELNPTERPPFNIPIGDMGIQTCIMKLRFASRALRGEGVNSGLRLIYAWIEQEQRIVFVELYHKNDKQTENRQRILKHFQ